MYHYHIYDFQFESDIRLFNIPLSDFTDTCPDVRIYTGIVNIEDINDKFTNFYIKKDYAIVKISYGVLRINSGKEIIYSINEGYSLESITPYIMGWGIAFLLTQRGHSAFHCSALTHNDKCFFISGVSGAGKSSTSLELIKHGCKYLCDDIAIVDTYENMMIPPAFPIQKVCPDVASDLNKDQLYAINNNRGKYSYLNTKDYCDTPKRLNVIFKLMIDDIPEVEVKEITGIDKFLRVLECLFFNLQYAQSSLPGDEQFRCLKIAEKVKVYTITRPGGKSTLNEITDIILQILDKNGD